VKRYVFKDGIRMDGGYEGRCADTFMRKVKERIEKKGREPLDTGQYNAVWEEMYELVKRIMSDD
jgi:hypothetical protein